MTREKLIRGICLEEMKEVDGVMKLVEVHPQDAFLVRCLDCLCTVLVCLFETRHIKESDMVCGACGSKNTKIEE